ncbi:MAG TPA: hypothetical protein GXX38_01490 [Clostridia bacterium]|jgi:hypothetical protein|nr:hypothetical protein [Clostridia bacterium]
MILKRKLSQKQLKETGYLVNLQIYSSVESEVKELKAKLKKMHKKMLKQNPIKNKKEITPENFIIIFKYSSYTEQLPGKKSINFDHYLGFFKNSYVKLTAQYLTDESIEQMNNNDLTWKYEFLPDQAVYNILSDRIVLYKFRLFVNQLN